MLEDTATTEEDQSTEDVEIEDTLIPTHPYDMPGEWFVLNAQSGHEKKVKTNIFQITGLVVTVVYIDPIKTSFFSFLLIFLFLSARLFFPPSPDLPANFRRLS